MDSADTGSNWGIYHRQIDSAVGDIPGNSIGFVGGGASVMQAYINLLNGDAYFRGSVSIGGNTAIHAGNISSQSVNYAASSGSVAWGDVSSKPAGWLSAATLYQGNEPNTNVPSGFYESYLGAGNPT